MQNENLGAADRIIQTLLTYSDHMVHNRPGYVVADATSVVGVKWVPVTHKVEDGKKVVYKQTKVGKKMTLTRVGELQDNLQIKEGARVVGEYRRPGIYPEVAAWMYGQALEVWRLDNEFAARWASYAFGQEHKDLKVILAALMLVQSRKGEPVKEDDKVLFLDEDFRDVGEAMALLARKGDKHLDARLLLRVHDLLTLPGVAKLNHTAGFGRSARHAFTGRWSTAVEKWLRHREENPKLLKGLVEKGFRTSVMELARRVGYKPSTPGFFEILRWKQAQAKDGRRQIAIGTAVTAAETWEGLTEEAICKQVEANKPNLKRAVGMLPKQMGLTRAIMAALIENGGLSPKDMIIYTPTLEELGLLEVQDVRVRWERAVKNAEDMRAANIASRVKSQATKDKLEEASDNALKNAVEEVTRGLRIYLIVDVSGSMQGAIEAAKVILARFVQSFPLDRLHVSIFNSSGREITIKHASKAGVEAAFHGVQAGGATDLGAGIRALKGHKPAADEDVLILAVTDEDASPTPFVTAIRDSNLNPMAIGLVKVGGNERTRAVRDAAAILGVPCPQIDNRVFEDPYGIPRAIRNLVAATPVGANTVAAAPKPRVSLVDVIVKTPLLQKPAWAIAA
jgi:hypothetical protein